MRRTDNNKEHSTRDQRSIETDRKLLFLGKFVLVAVVPLIASFLSLSVSVKVLRTLSSYSRGFGRTSFPNKHHLWERERLKILLILLVVYSFCKMQRLLSVVGQTINNKQTLFSLLSQPWFMRHWWFTTRKRNIFPFSEDERRKERRDRKRKKSMRLFFLLLLCLPRVLESSNSLLWQEEGCEANRKRNLIPKKDHHITIFLFSV